MPLQVTMTRGSDGETLSSFSIKLDPAEVCFAERKGEPGQTKRDSCTISINVGKRNLYLITVSSQLEWSYSTPLSDLPMIRWNVQLELTCRS